MQSAFMTHGGPEALKWEEVTVGEPGPGEVLMRQTAVGLNYIDTYHRTGHYKVAGLPAVIGMEGAGRVMAVGSGVTDVAGRPRGLRDGARRYAEERLIAADRLVKLPPCNRREDCRRDDAAGHDRALSAARDLPLHGQDGAAVPRSRGRRRPHRLPMGTRDRRDDHRDGRLGGEGAARARSMAVRTSSTIEPRTTLRA